MNAGHFSKNNNYIKVVDLDRAVLWMTRELSVPVRIMQEITNRNCKYMKFVDHNKQTKYVFKVDRVKKSMKLRTVAQEPQYYFSIDLREEQEEAPQDQLDGGGLFNALANIPEDRIAALRAKLQTNKRYATR